MSNGLRNTLAVVVGGLGATLLAYFFDSWPFGDTHYVATPVAVEEVIDEIDTDEETEQQAADAEHEREEK